MFLSISGEASAKITEFLQFFYYTFVNPFFRLLRDTDVLGFPLFNWLFGLTVISFAVRFFKLFFPSDPDEK